LIVSRAQVDDVVSTEHGAMERSRRDALSPEPSPAKQVSQWTVACI
jgi:hypothetical protein